MSTHTLYHHLNELEKSMGDISVIEMAKHLGLIAISHPFKEIANTARQIISERIS